MIVLTGMTFEQLLCSDAKDAEIELRRLLTLLKNCKAIFVFKANPILGSDTKSALEMAPVRVYSLDANAHLNTGAIPKFIWAS